MALKVTLFSDFICPFCYIGFQTIRKMKREFDLDVDWRGFQIHPDWPATGIPAEKVYGADGPHRARPHGSGFQRWPLRSASRCARPRC